MPSSSFARRAFVCFVLAAVVRCFGEEVQTLRLASEHGAAIAFTSGEGAAWRWTTLTFPGGRRDGNSVVDSGVHVATAAASDALEGGWQRMETTDNSLVFEQDAAATGLRVRRVFSFGPAPHVLRIETWMRSPGGTQVLERAGFVNVQVPGERFRETGAAPGSFPLFGRSLFFGLEHVSGECHTTGDTAHLWQSPRLAIGEDWTFVAASVVGWTVPGAARGLFGEARMRQTFLDYLDTVRIKPERMVLHIDTWWTLPVPLTEKDVMNDITALERGFRGRTGMFFDTYCLDLGWSNPRSLWQIDRRQFPNGFKAIEERLAGLGTKLGLWLSPGSAYEAGLDNRWLKAQGYEVTPQEDGTDLACFALGGRYQREFREAVVSYAREYGLGHVILDAISQHCDVPTHGHPVGTDSRYAIDAGIADVLDELRAVNPTMALEPMVCGYPPSPWWLMKTPFVMGPVGDDVPFGRVPSFDWYEALITARDAAYRAGQEAWIMPTQALETFDVVIQTPGEFRNMAVMAIGRGRWFICTYVKPELMQPDDWDFMAGLVRWARHNQDYLRNAWQIGGKPENREAYGFMFRNADKDLYCVRNPWLEERSIHLPVGAVNGARDVRMIYPRRATLARVPAGSRAPMVALAPYETAIIEIVPAEGDGPTFEARDTLEASVAATPPRVTMNTLTVANRVLRPTRFEWEGTLTVPEINEPEICVLVEGAADVELAVARISVDGRELKVTRSTSAGQFGAARDPSPDNWTWLTAPVKPGSASSFRVDLNLLVADANVSVYVRGFTPATDEAPREEDGPALPGFQSGRRGWSQLVLPTTPVTAGP